MLVGLINSKKQRVPFDELDKRYKREDWIIPELLTWNTSASWPLAMLKAMGRDNRQPGKVHVSNLLNAPLREVLKRNNGYYAEPEDLLFIADGSAFHAWLAFHGGLGAENRYDMKLNIGSTTVTITGEPDYAVHKGALIDHKRTKSYSLKKLLENGLEEERPEMARQLRYYSVLLKANGIEPVTPYRIFVWASDWQKQFRRKEQDPRMAEFEVMPTPHDKEEMVTRARAFVMACAMPVEEIPACEDREAFGFPKGKDIPRRCADYCEVNQFCPAYQKMKKGLFA
jgi:hypothetical protein